MSDENEQQAPIRRLSEQDAALPGAVTTKAQSESARVESQVAVLQNCIEPSDGFHRKVPSVPIKAEHDPGGVVAAGYMGTSPQTIARLNVALADAREDAPQSVPRPNVRSSQHRLTSAAAAEGVGQRERRRSADSAVISGPKDARHEAKFNARPFLDSAAFPPTFDQRYAVDGDKVVDINKRDRVLMRDRGNRLDAGKEFDSETIKLMVDTAEARGWSHLVVKGSEEFRKSVWMAAVARGIDVAGATTTAADQAWAERQREATGKANVVKPNDAVKAFLEATSKSDRMTAAVKHPELVNAFTQDALWIKVSAQLRPESAQKAFMERMRQTIALDLAQGREIVPIALINPMFKKDARVQVRDRDRDRER